MTAGAGSATVAILPSAIRPMTDPEKQIDRINEISAIARTSWLALLGYLAFIGISLLAVEDADFFVETRRTDLPLVGVTIPTYSFFFFAPILAAALYVYLQVHLLKLWDAIADAPSVIDGRPLGEHLHPWIANDHALVLKGSAPCVRARCVGSATFPHNFCFGSPARR